jgi:hypothetical protein
VSPQEVRGHVRFIRDWRPGDPKRAKGRSLWIDAEGEVWLSPAEVKSLGLTDLMRGTLEGGDQATSSNLVERLAQEQDTPVSAETYWHEAHERSQDDRAERDLAQAVQRATSSDPGVKVEATVTGGQTADGWRWWLVEDGEQKLVAYDNRPQLDAWHQDQIRWGNSQQREGEAPPPAMSPSLVQGVIPLALCRAIVSADHEAHGGLALHEPEAIVDRRTPPAPRQTRRHHKEPTCYCGKPESVCVRENGAHCRHPFAHAHMWGDG